MPETKKSLARIALLYDYYSPMLTEHQKDALDLYYNEDLSLAEIAENLGITRQAVRDAIKQGERKLFYFEERLGFVERNEYASRLITEGEYEKALEILARRK